jgi:hypothetical protein
MKRRSGTGNAYPGARIVLVGLSLWLVVPPCTSRATIYYVDANSPAASNSNAEGEWAYDANRRRLYLWPRGEAPEDVEFTYRDYCLRTDDSAAFTAVRGLTMRNAHEYGIFLYLAHDMTVENNTVAYVFGHSIHLESNYGPCNDNQILRNTIRHSGDRGINVSEAAAHCQIEGNTVYASGVEHYGGDLMNGNGAGIYVVGPFARVYGNRIDRAGRAGLYLHGGALGREVYYNYITNSGLALSDTGGLYGAGRAAGAGQELHPPQYHRRYAGVPDDGQEP